jgi:predicted Zn-dependent peptidase
MNNNLITKNIKEENKKTSIPIEKTFTADAIYFVNDKNYLQSNIHFYVPGIAMKRLDENKIVCKSFNQYFGNDMYSLVFQEIREFRSLGYAAYSRYLYDYLDRKPSYLYAFLGTQSDKTVEGIAAMRSLITDMPVKTEKFAGAKESLLAIYRSWYLGFREIPYQVYKWKAEGYAECPVKNTINKLETIDFNDVQSFYEKTMKGKPVIISLSGNMGKVNKKELSKFGTLKEVKISKIFCE